MRIFLVFLTFLVMMMPQNVFAEVKITNLYIGMPLSEIKGAVVPCEKDLCGEILFGGKSWSGRYIIEGDSLAGIGISLPADYDSLNAAFTGIQDSPYVLLYAETNTSNYNFLESARLEKDTETVQEEYRNWTHNIGENVSYTLYFYAEAHVFNYLKKLREEYFLLTSQEYRDEYIRKEEERKEDKRKEQARLEKERKAEEERQRRIKEQEENTFENRNLRQIRISRNESQENNSEKDNSEKVVENISTEEILLPIPLNDLENLEEDFFSLAKNDPEMENMVITLVSVTEHEIRILSATMAMVQGRLKEIQDMYKDEQVISQPQPLQQNFKKK